MRYSAYFISAFPSVYPSFTPGCPAPITHLYPAAGPLCWKLHNGFSLSWNHYSTSPSPPSTLPGLHFSGWGL